MFKIELKIGAVMEEQLFNEIVSKDLQRFNDLVRKGWFGTSDFKDAALTLSNSLAMYHQEVSNEVCKEREYLQKRKLA